MILRAPYPDAISGGGGGGSTHEWTPLDSASATKIGFWWFPYKNYTLDSASKVAAIANNFPDASRTCSTANAAKRHSIAQVNGYDTAFSADTTLNGILLDNTTGIPTGNADLCMIFVQMPQDGVVGGYRGGNNYWIDNPFPDYRLRTNAGDFTATGNTNNSTLHTLVVNRKAGVTTIRVDGDARGTHAPSGGYNTTLGTWGLKGADVAYYPLKGATAGGALYGGALSDDEVYKWEAWAAKVTGQTIRTDNPYKGGLPQVSNFAPANDNIAFLRESVQRKIYLPSRLAA